MAVKKTISKNKSGILQKNLRSEKKLFKIGDTRPEQTNYVTKV